MVFMKQQGQSTLEYALLVAVIVAGLIGMQLYFKRGQMGRLRQAADDIGEQFAPQDYHGDFNTTITVRRTELSDQTGKVETMGIFEEQKRSGDEFVDSTLAAEGKGAVGGLFE